MISAAPPLASEPIDSFTTTTSTTQAGGHPDLRPPSRFDNPGDPRPPKTSSSTRPKGVFGNANAITQCTSVDFALEQCPSSSQAGLITIHANYHGDPNYLLGTAASL